MSVSLADCRGPTSIPVATTQPPARWSVPQVPLRNVPPPLPRTKRRRLPPRGYVWFSRNHTRWPASNHYTDWFRTRGLCSFSCRRSHHRHPFYSCPSFDSRNFPPPSDFVHPGEEANLRLLHVFIPDSGISRTQAQTACCPHVWRLADGILISDSSFVNLLSRSTAASRRPPNEPHTPRLPATVNAVVWTHASPLILPWAHITHCHQLDQKD